MTDRKWLKSCAGAALDANHPACPKLSPPRQSEQNVNGDDAGRAISLASAVPDICDMEVFLSPCTSTNVWSQQRELQDICCKIKKKIIKKQDGQIEPTCALLKVLCIYFLPSLPLLVGSKFGHCDRVRKKKKKKI